MVSRQETAEYVTELKRSFIDTKLTPLLRAIDSSIDDVSYRAEISDGNIIEEIVTVTFKSGGIRYIDITGDSLKAAVTDIIRYF